MMVPSQRSWWRLVFKYTGTELPRTKYRIAGVALVACIVTLLEHEHDWHPNLKPLPFTLIGVALGIFLGFRNNASYDRWWEGRKLWGALVNTTRTFTRQVLTLVGPRPGGPEIDAGELREFQREIVLRIAAFAHALRLALRDEDDLSELESFLPADEVERLRSESNRPFAITQGTAERMRAAWQKGWVDTLHVPILEASMTALTDIQGGCERIKATPIPFSYTTLIHRITAVYCYALPFGLVDEIGLYTPFAVILVAYAFFGLDVVGDEIEMPFGNDPNDLPLRGISRMIEVNLKQRIGESPLPALLRPVDEILD